MVSTGFQTQISACYYCINTRVRVLGIGHYK